MRLRRNALEILQARPLADFDWLVHGFSTRAGGASELDGQLVLNLGHTDWDTRARVAANRASFLAALGVEHTELVTLRQMHSDFVHELDESSAQSPARRGALRGDALITRVPGLLLAVQTADCIPILLADPKRRAVAAVHAGWRGTLKRIVAKTVGQMQMRFSTRPADLLAALGPGIGVCCYEVGTEVAQAFASQFARAGDWFEGPFDKLASSEEPSPPKWLSRRPPGQNPPALRLRLNLLAANRWQLVDTGLKPENILATELCTACRTDLLFSHRQERGRTGRLMGVIGLRR